jgi:phage/plasmid-like protein (TIGR03299 family)
MSHEVDMSNGRANMAYVGEKPWHGLGTELPQGVSLDVARGAAGLGWEILPTVSQFEFAGQLRDSDHFHMVRSDTGASLGVMTSRYNVHQPKDVVEFFDDFIKADPRFSLETLGALYGGSRIWALAKFVDPMVAAGDKHIPYVLLTTSFDGTMATTAQATMIRVVCKNTLTASIWSKDSATVKVRHSKAWTPATIDAARADLEKVAGSFQQYKGLADGLATVRMTREATENLFKELVFKGNEKESGKAKAQFEALFSSYVDTVAEGTEAGTAWTALNSVTRYVDHSRSTRRTDGASEGDARMASSFFGSGAALKAKALSYLQDMPVSKPVAVSMPQMVAAASAKPAQTIEHASFLDAAICATSETYGA